MNGTKNRIVNLINDHHMTKKHWIQLYFRIFIFSLNKFCKFIKSFTCFSFPFIPLSPATFSFHWMPYYGQTLNSKYDEQEAFCSRQKNYRFFLNDWNFGTKKRKEKLKIVLSTWHHFPNIILQRRFVFRWLCFLK